MIEVNREMTWEEACSLYQKKMAFFRIITRRKYFDEMFPEIIYVERVAENSEEVVAMCKELVERGIDSIKFNNFPREAYPIAPPGIGMPILAEASL